MQICVTGAGGFVGRGLVDWLVRTDGVRVRALGTRATGGPSMVQPVPEPTHRAAGTLPRDTDGRSGAVAIDHVVLPDWSMDQPWARWFAGQQVVVHCAARVHQMQESIHTAAALHQAVNCDLTVALARAAAAAGVRRFVYLSTVKVHGESTLPDRPLRADSPLPPTEDAYARSKQAAEAALWRVSQQTGLECVVIRPPLVYGPGVGANFAALLRALQRGWPLPLGAVRHNRRSLVARDNLCSLIALACHHPAAAGRAWLVSDDDDLSTAALLEQMAQALGRPARLLSIPVPLLRAAAAVTGRRSLMARLTDSLQVDVVQTRQLLGWFPVVGVRAALGQMVG